MTHYDFLIAGGGCAGLSMTLQLAHLYGADVRILVVDRTTKKENDRSWAFWSKEELPLGLDAIVSKKWSNLSFACSDFKRAASIAPYEYKFIRGIDYYRYMHEQLAAFPNVEFLLGEIQNITQTGNTVYCEVGSQQIQAARVFDSRVSHAALSASGSKDYLLWQHFGGQFIRTTKPVFQSDTATLMDFSTTANSDETAFYYVLPFSDREALVEYTAFSDNFAYETHANTQIANYTKQVLGIAEYEILEHETGKIPMTNIRLNALAAGNLIHPIGTAANQVKSTTGYAFLRIHAYNAAIVSALENGTQLPEPSATTGRFRWYDDLLLHILSRKPAAGASIFKALFGRTHFATILRFLNEESHPLEEARIFSHLPLGLFLEAVATHHGFKKDKHSSALTSLAASPQGVWMLKKMGS